MKFQSLFSWKRKTNINLSSAELAQRVVNVKFVMLLSLNYIDLACESVYLYK